MHSYVMRDPDTEYTCCPACNGIFDELGNIVNGMEE